MGVFIDHLNRKVELLEPPHKVVSTVPSQTELLFDLGLGNKVVGLTRFCIHPKDEVKFKTNIGGTKQLKVKTISSLVPSFILANKEENEQEEIELLSKQFPVWISDIKSLEDNFNLIYELGKIFQIQDKANELRDKISSAFTPLEKENFTPKTALYLIWNKPLMAAGKNTFVDYMMQKAGFENVLKTSRYPQLSEQDVLNLNPEVVLLSSEPYPFGEKHIHFFQNLLPNAKIILVDGEMFSWYGSRILKAPKYFIQLQTTLRL